eukprot:UN02654
MRTITTDTQYLHGSVGILLGHMWVYTSLILYYAVITTFVLYTKVKHVQYESIPGYLSGFSLLYLTMHLFGMTILLMSKDAQSASTTELILAMAFGLTGGSLLSASDDIPFSFWTYINPYWWITQCLLSQLDKDYDTANQDIDR